MTFAVRRVTRNLGMTPVLLSHYGWDTRVGPRDCGAVVDMMIENATLHRGGMFVFHDGNLCPPKVAQPSWDCSVENRSWVPAAVDRVITELKSQELRFVIPELDEPEPVMQMKAAA